MDGELEELKKNRMAELKQAYSEQLNKQMQEHQRAETEAAKQLEALEEGVKAHFTKEALQRYSAVKLAHPETAVRLLVAVAQAINKGRLAGMLTDEQLISVLRQLSQLTQPQKETRIKIIRK